MLFDIVVLSIACCVGLSSNRTSGCSFGRSVQCLETTRSVHSCSDEYSRNASRERGLVAHEPHAHKSANRAGESGSLAAARRVLYVAVFSNDLTSVGCGTLGRDIVVPPRGTPQGCSMEVVTMG